MGDTFVFSIEAAYSGVGSLGNMGTYIGNEGGPYLFLSREPLACAAGKKNKYLVKVQASHFLIDTSTKTYGSLLSPDRALSMAIIQLRRENRTHSLRTPRCATARVYQRRSLHACSLFKLRGVKRRQQGNKRVVIVSTARRAAAS